ncbi:MAG TPA: methyltransferase [Alphaproteobacteria bacterium]|nr:methyltransferase [Rhodospirillaceae bacterium]HRJ12343.1 methyltransferase [Alphaproteobacteria bacterium]
MTTDTSYLLDGRVKITQSQDGYRAGMDAIFLAAACPIEPGETLLDLGCGVGAASLCTAARVTDIHVTGIEIQPAQAAFAEQNFAANNLTAEMITGDIRTYQFQSDQFDHVICNPPYHDDHQHDAPQDGARKIAFMMDDLTIWIAAARRAVKTHGSFTLIHRADALPEIMTQMHGFGAIEVIPIWPQPDMAASRIVIRARKGRKTPLKLYPGIALHTNNGENTENAYNILRKGVKIP